MNVLRRNLGYKILSLFIAILLYYVAYTQQNPRSSREVFVRPEVVNLPGALLVKSPPDGNVVMVIGSESALDLLRTQPVTARVDASRAKEGENRLPIVYDVPDSLRSRVSVDGASLAQVVLTKKERRDFFVDAIYDETPPIGFAFGDPMVEPRQVYVEGLPSDVARVSRVVASVEPGQAQGAIDRTVTLVAQDVKQKVVDTVTIDPAQARVKIGLKRIPSTKMVLLSAQMKGDPAPGYVVEDYEFQPQMVTIAGPQEALAERSSLSVSVDIDGISETQTKTVKLAPPPGITLKNAPQSVRVRLDVRPVRGNAEKPTRPSPSSATPPRNKPKPPPRNTSSSSNGSATPGNGEKNSSSGGSGDEKNNSGGSGNGENGGGEKNDGGRSKSLPDDAVE